MENSRILCTDVVVYADQPTNRQRYFRDVLLIKLGFDGDSALRRMKDEFCDVVAFTTKVEGDPGFVMPTLNSTEDEVKAAFEVYLDVNGVQSEEWLTFIRMWLRPSNNKRSTQPPPLSVEEIKNDPN